MRRRVVASLSALLSVSLAAAALWAKPASADDGEGIIIVSALCIVGAAGTAAVAGGLAFSENSAGRDARLAANAFRLEPTQTNARAASAARERWQEAHDFNSGDDTYTLLVGVTGLIGASMCLGGFAAMVE
jgi:hypothetical protein